MSKLSGLQGLPEDVRELLEGETSKERQQQSRQFSRDCRFFDAHYHELLKRYPNQWVAIFQGKVIDSDKSHDHLIRRLRRKGLDVNWMIFRRLETERRIKIVPVVA